MLNKKCKICRGPLIQIYVTIAMHNVERYVCLKCGTQHAPEYLRPVPYDTLVMQLFNYKAGYSSKYYSTESVKPYISSTWS